MIIDNQESNKSSGILIDWDLCKAIGPEDGGTVTRQYRCMVHKFYKAAWTLMPDVYSYQGTWQFVKAAAGLG